MRKQIAVAALLVAFGAGAFAKEVNKSTLDLAVTEKGFEPKSIDVKPGSDVTLRVTRKTDSTCAKQIQVPSKNLKVDLPLNKPVMVSLGKAEKGEIRFGCGMDMMEKGQIVVR